MTRDKTVGLITFVLHCTAAATIAYLLASAVGLRCEVILGMLVGGLLHISAEKIGV